MYEYKYINEHVDPDVAVPSGDNPNGIYGGPDISASDSNPEGGNGEAFDGNSYPDGNDGETPDSIFI